MTEADWPHPGWLLECAVEPKTKADQEKLAAALDRVAAEDTRFGFEFDLESGQVIVKAGDERHLEAAIGRLRTEFAIEMNVGAPQIAYRETVTRAAEVDYLHHKTRAGSTQHARVRLRVAPAAQANGCSIEHDFADAPTAEEVISAIETGLRSVIASGPVAGFPLTGVAITLLEGVTDSPEPSPVAFEIAGRAAMREGVGKAGPKLMEPIMRIEIATPERYAAAVVGDLMSRRSDVLDREVRDGEIVIAAVAPLFGLFGHANALNSLSRGQARVSLRFDHFAPVPENFGDDPDDNFPQAAALRA